MKIYVINLDRSTNRLIYMRKMFAKLNLSFTRVAAVDAQTIELMPKKNPSQKDLWPEDLTFGEIGCFLSHKKVFEMIASGDEIYAVVCEDDIALAPLAEQLLTNTQWIPADSDFIKLESQSRNKIFLGPVKTICGSNTELRELKSTNLLSAAYIISKSAAQKLLPHMETVSMPIDHFLFNSRFPIFQHFKYYQLDPVIAKQIAFPSTLAGERHHRNKKAKARRPIHFTIKREIFRLLKRLIIVVRGGIINKFTKSRWKRVKIDPNVRQNLVL